MKMNNRLATLMAAGMFLTPMAAYCADQTATTPKPEVAVKGTKKADYSILNGKTGLVNYSVWSEEKVTALSNRKLGTSIKKFIFIDSMSDGLAMLKSGRADFMMTSDATAAYVIQRNPEFKSVVFSDENGLSMLLRNSDAALRNSFNSAISKLKSSGKLDELFKKWVTNLPVGQMPVSEKVEKTSYPETIYVGVTGDIPPLDYVGADGKPAGYNIALLAEISKIIGKNIEPVSISAQARWPALQSKKIDVFFWQRMPNKRDMAMVVKDPDEMAFHKKFTFTEPYCFIKTVLLMRVQPSTVETKNENK